MDSNGNYIDHKQTYLYPKYVPNNQLLQGLFFYEWLAVVAPVAFGLFIAQILGVIIGAVIAGSLYFLFVRTNGKRTNFAHELMCSFNYYMQQQEFRRTPRSSIKGSGEFLFIEEEGTEEKEDTSLSSPGEVQTKKRGRKGKKKDPKKKSGKPKAKVNRKEKAKKEKNMEDLFPFKSISNGYVEMENKAIFLYFRIQANNLNLLSDYDINKMIGTFERNMNSNKYQISFFIQDSIYKIKKNLDEIERCKEKNEVPFLRLLLDQTKDMIVEEKEDVNKKIYILRVKIPPSKAKIISIEETQGRILKNFKDSLNPLIVSRDEIKQMLAIHGNRIFSEDLPDTEFKIEKKDVKSLIRRKKITFEDTQLPGIYNFKNMIVPINVSFKPSFAKIGRNITKTYAVSTFLGSTQESNLLSKVSSIKGVTTMIYLTDLKLSKYRSNVKLETKAQRATITDELDKIDSETHVDELQGTYKRVKDKKQKMYYMTVYFQLSAKTQKAFDDLEDEFNQEIEDVNLTLDALETQQKDGYLSTSPIGNDILSEYTKQNIPSDSVANLYPFNEPSLLDPTGLPLGKIVNSPLMVLFDPFTFRGSNFNILTLGASGQGKTVLLMMILQICAVKNYYIRNIDFEGVYVKFFDKIGGVNIDVSGGNEFCINPLQVRVPDEVKNTILDDYISEVVKFISIYKPDWTNDVLDLFQDILKKTYDRFHINNDVDFTKLKALDYPILRDVLETARSERKNAGTEDSIASVGMYQKILLGLNAAVNGADACMFNRHTYLGKDDINDIRSINFDMSRIMTSNKSRKLAQLMNVFTYISQFVNANMEGSKKIIVSVDEMDKCLTLEYLPIIEIFNDYERRFRKRFAIFLKATQTIDEVDSKIPELEAKIKPLLSQPPIKFLFHLGDIDYEQPKRLLNLTDTEINRLKDARNGQCLMKVNQAIYDLDVLMPVWFDEVKPDNKRNAS